MAVDPDCGRPLEIIAVGERNGWIPAILRPDEARQEDICVRRFRGTAANPRTRSPTGPVSTDCGKRKSPRKPGLPAVDLDAGQQPPLPRVVCQTLHRRGGDRQEKCSEKKHSPQLPYSLRNSLPGANNGPVDQAGGPSARRRNGSLGRCRTFGRVAIQSAGQSRSGRLDWKKKGGSPTWAPPLMPSRSVDLLSLMERRFLG